MHSSGSSEANQPEIIQNDKFFARILSKETSSSTPSFRVYYGVSTIAVPFRWESHPGTPKHAMAASSIPPLTPPPSYHCFDPLRKKSDQISTSKYMLVRSILSRFINLSRNHRPDSSSSTRSSAASSQSSYSSFEDGYSPRSALRIREKPIACGGCYSMGKMKNLLMYAVRH